MAITYGFYDSLNGDRKYNATQMSSIFDGIIEDGVYMQIGNRFNVAASDGMSVSVDTGRAWFNHTWTLNDAKIILPIDKQGAPLHRIDSVVLEVNHALDYRRNEIKIVKGYAEANPAAPKLTRSLEVNQYRLADIYVRNTDETTAISNSDITNKVGTSECPYVTAPLKTINADQLLQQWNAQWNEELANQNKKFNSKYDELSSYISGSQTQFNNWFANIQYVLSGDAAGKLQTEIDKLNFSSQVMLDKNKWTAVDNKFSQSVSLAGVTTATNLEVWANVVSSMDAAAQKAYLKAYAIVSSGYAVPDTDTITFYVYKKPATTITIKIKGGISSGAGSNVPGAGSNMVATESTDGLMSAADKAKLDRIDPSAIATNTENIKKNADEIAKLKSATAEYRLMKNPETEHMALAHYTKEA